MWTCRRCNEKNEDRFDACWRCGTKIDGTPPANPDEFKKRENEAKESGNQDYSEAEEPDNNENQSPKEYKRICRKCGKVWYTLVSRERALTVQSVGNVAGAMANCCSPSGTAQVSRNIDATSSELDRLRKCPECLSSDYHEEIV